MLTYDKQAQEEMLCHLRPGTEYKVSVEVLDHQGQTPKYTPTASVSTPSSGKQASIKNFEFASLSNIVSNNFVNSLRYSYCGARRSL